ncbi:uncharacterized protein TRAVEDRAFT_42212 [Trametes versicolor FP-101664 SS1]|uniref:uncharacterized protein n=1 Tax=Trametes versicolor (strain FP-101664) TaxID=717944 RepID=UPI00046243DF|nr:uncharacterized protein TRAVEDRAFT_42212 [Trametes versicolor FP-101664 SS1]EIW64797.1 hypothetical protein TRAVEDRAFT_42212 [Trametes versicolor FP-101664 SS1]
MSDFSDTESESSVSESGWDAADFMQLAAELGRIGETPALLEVPDALNTLHSLDICAVEHDEQLHETIQHVSNALISFLDSIVLPHERHMGEVQANLLALLDESCMALLLQYRVLFRAIASRSMVESSSSIPTASWLHHLDVSAADISIGHSVGWWDDQLVDALECDPPTALSMMSRLLLAIVTSKDSAVALRENATMDVVLKICWSVKHMLQAMPLDDATLSVLYGIMYKLFLRLGDQALDLAVKDLIVEVLSLSLENVRLALASLCDPKSECPLKWEQKLSHHIKSANKSCRDDTSVLELRSMRQALQVLALAWRADCTPFPASETMSRRFLSVLLGWLESESLESLVWTMLGDATIGALAVSSRSATTLTDYCWANLIWGLFQDADPADLPMAASLAAYMIAIVQVSPVEGLVCAEAWDYFRDVMLLILNRDFGGADEPFALLVCPPICRVLVALVRNAPQATVRYYSASPWTGCMVMHMKSVKEEDEQNDEYTSMLRELIGPFVEVLFLSLEERARKTSRKTRSRGTVTDQLKNLDDLEFTFCWSQGQACLVPS